MASKTVAITRPVSDKDALTGLLHKHGYNVIQEPITNIVLRTSAQTPLEEALLSQPDAIIVTSRYGVRALAALTSQRDLALICVGPATGRAALASGFSRVFIAGGTVEHIMEYILASYDEGSYFLYVSAEHIRMNLAAALSKQGMRVQNVVAYEAVAATQFSDTFAEHVRRGQIDVVTFLSQRAAQVFQSLAEKAELEKALGKMHACCLSKAIAKSLDKGLWKRVHAASNPSLAALAECIDTAVTARKKKA